MKYTIILENENKQTIYNYNDLLQFYNDFEYGDLQNHTKAYIYNENNKKIEERTKKGTEQNEK